MKKENLKILAIGDIHGRPIWKKIVEKEQDSVDKIVFIGDYFDDFRLSPEKIQENFKDILEYKRQYPDKVVLLIGNHDFHYIFPSTGLCSGHDDKKKLSNGLLLTEALSKGDLQMSYMTDDILFTHAGASSSWLYQNGIRDTKDLSGYINKLVASPHSFAFWKFDVSSSGEHPCQSCVWIRPETLDKEMPEGIKQVVGHTVMNYGIQIIEDNLILIDALAVKEYLKIEEGKFIIKKI